MGKHDNTCNPIHTVLIGIMYRADLDQEKKDESHIDTVRLTNHLLATAFYALPTIRRK
jgi:hypothetical protein